MKLDTSPREWLRLRRTVGVILVIAAPALAAGKWYSTQPPLATLKMAQDLHLPASEIASATYMAGFAQEALDNKWKPTGFATLGTVGFLIGAILLYSARPAAGAPRARVPETS